MAIGMGEVRPALETRSRSLDHAASSAWRWMIVVLATLSQGSIVASSFVAMPPGAANTRAPPCLSASAPSPSHDDEKCDLAGTMAMPAPPTTSPTFALYHLVRQQRAAGAGDGRGGIPLAGVHDALSARVFAQRGAPALFLSGFGVSAALLGMPDAGATTLTEMAATARRVRHAVRDARPGGGVVVDGVRHPPPLVVDGDTGHGGAPNMLRTLSELASAGAAAVTIEDQRFPKRCAIAAGSNVQVVGRDEAVQRVKGALGAREHYAQRSAAGAAGPWIVARTDCRRAHGLAEAVERCVRFEQLGAEVVYAEHLRGREEYARLRAALDPRTVTVLAQVQGAPGVRDPPLSARDVGELGFDFALFGVSPLQCVVGALDGAAQEFLGNGARGATVGAGIIGDGGSGPLTGAMADFATLKQAVGFAELEDFEREFPCA